jgi:hypothetical protein
MENLISKILVKIRITTCKHKRNREENIHAHKPEKNSNTFGTIINK